MPSRNEPMSIAVDILDSSLSNYGNSLRCSGCTAEKSLWNQNSFFGE